MNAVQLEQKQMKFVINGRTFDTASATVAAIARGTSQDSPYDDSPDSERRWEIVLYRTAKGAFFIHDHTTTKYFKGGRPVTSDVAEELTPEKAIAWIEAMSAVVMDGEGLPLPPEA